MTGTTRQNQYHGRMGLNPFRQQRKTLADVAMMVAAIAAALGAVAWAIFAN